MTDDKTPENQTTQDALHGFAGGDVKPAAPSKAMPTAQSGIDAGVSGVGKFNDLVTDMDVINGAMPGGADANNLRRLMEGRNEGSKTSQPSRGFRK